MTFPSRSFDVFSALELAGLIAVPLPEPGGPLCRRAPNNMRRRFDENSDYDGSECRSFVARARC